MTWLQLHRVAACSAYPLPTPRTLLMRWTLPFRLRTLREAFSSCSLCPCTVTSRHDLHHDRGLLRRASTSTLWHGCATGRIGLLAFPKALQLLCSRTAIPLIPLHTACNTYPPRSAPTKALATVGLAVVVHRSRDAVEAWVADRICCISLGTHCAPPPVADSSLSHMGRSAIICICLYAIGLARSSLHTDLRRCVETLGLYPSHVLTLSLILASTPHYLRC